MLIQLIKVEYYKYIYIYKEQFWSYKFTTNSNLNKKIENYKFKKNI